MFSVSLLFQRLAGSESFLCKTYRVRFIPPLPATVSWQMAVSKAHVTKSWSFFFFSHSRNLIPVQIPPYDLRLLIGFSSVILFFNYYYYFFFGGCSVPMYNTCLQWISALTASSGKYTPEIQWFFTLKFSPDCSAKIEVWEWIMCFYYENTN